MKVKWLGHSSFLLTSARGVSLVTDPFDESLSYPFPTISADICTVSHDHFDHNCIRRLKNSPVVVKSTGKREVKGVTITGFSSFHDEKKGRERGANIIFRIEMDGLRIVHLGDLGHIPPEQTRQEIGEVHLLLLPVGGKYTIDARSATEVMKSLKPRITIPMHYKTEYLDFPIAPVDDFLRGKENVRHADELEVTAESLPGEDEIVVLRI